MISYLQYNALGSGSPGERAAYKQCEDQYLSWDCRAIPFYRTFMTSCEDQVSRIEACAALRVGVATARENADFNVAFPDTPSGSPVVSGQVFSQIQGEPLWLWIAGGVAAALILKGLMR